MDFTQAIQSLTQGITQAIQVAQPARQPLKVAGRSIAVFLAKRGVIPTRLYKSSLRNFMLANKDVCLGARAAEVMIDQIAATCVDEMPSVLGSGAAQPVGCASRHR